MTPSSVTSSLVRAVSRARAGLDAPHISRLSPQPAHPAEQSPSSTLRPLSFDIRRPTVAQLDRRLNELNLLEMECASIRRLELRGLRRSASRQRAALETVRRRPHRARLRCRSAMWGHPRTPTRRSRATTRRGSVVAAVQIRSLLPIALLMIRVRSFVMTVAMEICPMHRPVPRRSTSARSRGN